MNLLDAVAFKVEAAPLDLVSHPFPWWFQALINNPKIEVIDGDRFKYKPKYNIRNRKGLLNLLDKMDQKGQGGILYEDIEEALPKAEKAMEVKHLAMCTDSHDRCIGLAGCIV